ncbi:fibronectin type III-like domain-contianing protein [Microbacterium sp. JZ70]
MSAATNGLTASVTVTNTGSRRGREVAQFYVSAPGATVRRAVRELAAFDAVELEPGESATIDVDLRREDLSFWDTAAGRWVLEPGADVVHVGASRRDLRLSASVELAGDVAETPLTDASTVGEMMAHPVVGPLVADMSGAAQGVDTVEGLGSDAMRMFAAIPLRQAVAMSSGNFTRE